MRIERLVGLLLSIAARAKITSPASMFSTNRLNSVATRNKSIHVSQKIGLLRLVLSAMMKYKNTGGSIIMTVRCAPMPR